MESTNSSSNPLFSVSTFIHQHCLRLTTQLSSRLDETRRFARKVSPNWPPLAAAQSISPSSLPFASLSQREGKHAFNIALSPDYVSKTLAGTSVYTVSNANNEFVLVSDPNGLKSIGLLCFRKEDAETFLAQVDYSLTIRFYLCNFWSTGLLKVYASISG